LGVNLHVLHPLVGVRMTYASVGIFDKEH